MERILCVLSLTGILCALQPASAFQPPVDKEECKKLQADLEKVRSQLRDSDGARTEILSVIGDGEVTEKTQVIVGED